MYISYRQVTNGADTAALSMLAETHLETASQALRATVQRIEARYAAEWNEPFGTYPSRLRFACELGKSFL